MDGIQGLFWFVLVPIGLVWLIKEVFQENRQKHNSITKATVQTAKDGGQLVFMAVVCIVGFLIFLWVINGLQTGVGEP